MQVEDGYGGEGSISRWRKVVEVQKECGGGGRIVEVREAYEGSVGGGGLL